MSLGFELIHSSPRESDIILLPFIQLEMIYSPSLGYSPRHLLDVRCRWNDHDDLCLSRGDSWRARASFIWELQLNLSAGTMSVDFGGEDRFDSGERQRNFDELNNYK